LHNQQFPDWTIHTAITAMASGRRVHDETQLDVDRMILDYLTFMAEKALFDGYESRVAGSTHSYDVAQSTQIPIQLVQCMYPLRPPF
jgi:replicative DNA helicase